MSDTYKPTDGMKSAARRALAWKKEGKRGGTIIGVTRANQIVRGDNLSASTVKRMYSFFSRHEVDKKATGFSSGEEGFPSPGRVAWDLWGGDAGFSWSRQKVASMKNMKKEIEPVEEEEALLNQRQYAIYEALETIAEQYGPFNKGIGADGIHYVEAAKNPFKSQGMVCKSCVLFEEGLCELLAENDLVEEEGVCKFWVIPESSINMKEASITKAENSSFKEGDFVSWMNEGMMMYGRIEHVMTDGMLGVPGSEYSIQATQEDPAILIRIYEQEEGEWEETEYLVGQKSSNVTSVKPNNNTMDQEVEKRDYNSKQRRRLASEGKAMPDGSFPIVTEQDLRNAIQSVGRAKNYEAAKRHIMRRARALGLTNLLPEDWKKPGMKKSAWGNMFLPEVEEL